MPSKRVTFELTNGRWVMFLKEDKNYEVWVWFCINDYIYHLEIFFPSIHSPSICWKLLIKWNGDMINNETKMVSDFIAASSSEEIK